MGWMFFNGVESLHLYWPQPVYQALEIKMSPLVNAMDAATTLHDALPASVNGT